MKTETDTFESAAADGAVWLDEIRDDVMKRGKVIAPPPPEQAADGPPVPVPDAPHHETTQHAPKLHEQRTKAIPPTARSQQRRFPR